MTSTKKIITANLLFVIFVTIIATLLIVLALPKNTMDVDTAQTLLAARYFARDGFLKHYFLQLPSGYGKITQYFDDQELQQHAGGTVNGIFLGKKRYYTHFPNFYIIPTVLMMKLGIEDLFLLRLLPIILSLLSLIFLYVFIKFVTDNKYIAFVGAVYFGISQVFLVSAKTLYFIPMENMLRFLILMLSILVIKYIKSSNVKIVRYYILSIWLFYFLLSLTSYNSTFFMFAYLVGLSAIYLYKLPFSHKIRTLSLLTILWASAPVLGFILQMIQNIAYLGWHNFLLDVHGAILSTGNSPKLLLTQRFNGWAKPFFTMTGLYNFYILTTPSPYTKIQIGLTILYELPKIKKYFFSSIVPISYIAPFIVAIVITAFFKLKKISEYALPSLSVPVLLLIAPLVQSTILPIVSIRDNAGLMTAPIVGIIIGTTVWMLFLAFFKVKLWGKILVVFMSVIVLSLFAVQIILDSSQYFSPNHIPLSDNEISFATSMKKVVIGEKAVFMINTVDTHLSEEVTKPRFAIIDPKEYIIQYRNWEYYFDMPLLNFTKTSYLVKDLLYLKKRADFPFTAIVVSDNFGLINELHLTLKQLSLTPIKTVDNMNLVPKDLDLSNTRYFFLVEK